MSGPGQAPGDLDNHLWGTGMHTDPPTGAVCCALHPLVPGRPAAMGDPTLSGQNPAGESSVWLRERQDINR